MEQAYGFTPTHTEQYISPTTHKNMKYNFQADTRIKTLAEIIVCNVFILFKTIC